jgi:hypothetical protein
VQDIDMGGKRARELEGIFQKIRLHTVRRNKNMPDHRALPDAAELEKAATAEYPNQIKLMSSRQRFSPRFGSQVNRSFPHIGHVYNLTGFESADLDHYARVFSEALGRTIHYRNVPLSEWSDKLRGFGVPAHLINHLAVMAELHAQGRYDRMTDDLFKLTGRTPTSVHDFVKLHAAEFTRRKPLA